jgi:hypothetical protein
VGLEFDWSLTRVDLELDFALLALGLELRLDLRLHWDLDLVGTEFGSDSQLDLVLLELDFFGPGFGLDLIIGLYRCRYQMSNVQSQMSDARG